MVGPIGDKFADHGSEQRDIYEQSLRVLEEVITPACEAFGISAIRSDEIAQPGEIPEQIFALLRDADLVIADLTGGNPNVMYELGLRHTRNRCTISIAEHERMPFDISVIRTIIFRRTRTGLIDARDELKASISECMQGNYRPVTATRLWSSDALSIDDLDPDPPAAAESEEEEQGFLERLAEMEEALPKLLTLMNELNEITGEIGSVFQDAQAKVEDMDARGASTSAARLTIAKQMGTQLEQRAARLEKVAEAYERELARADGGMSYMVSAVEQEPDRLQELGELPDAVGVAVAQMREAMAAGDETANTIASMASIAKPLRQPTRKIATAIRRVTRASTVFQVWDTRLQKVVLAGAREHG